MNAPEPTETALKVSELSKHFGGLHAVDRVSLSVPPGERRAIIGPNGAGKTTFFNLISGDLRPTDGRIYLYGRDVTALAPYRRVALGLGRTYQISSLFPELSVRENVQLAVQGVTGEKYSLWEPADQKQTPLRQVNQLLEDFQLASDAQLPVNELSHGAKRKLEIVLALAVKPELLLLDEPVAGLTHGERNRIANFIHSLPEDLTVILIEHDLELALDFATRVTVFHEGSILAQARPPRIRENEQVQEVYLGK